jgi:Xaa-Pro aminopeptidase
MARQNDLDLTYVSQRMKAENLDAIVSASPTGLFHTSGALIITHNPARDRLAFTVSAADGRQALVVCKAEESLCRQDSWVKDIRTYVEFQELPTTLLGRTLKDMGLSKGRIGIDLGYLRAKYFRELQDASPDAEFIAADAILADIYQRKTPHLIQQMHQAAANADRAIQDTLNSPIVGRTEREIRAALRAALADGGADATYIVVASGPNTTVPEHRADVRKIAAGDVLILDVAASYDGYVAESATTIVAGQANDPALTDLHKVYAAAAGTLKIGATGDDIYNASSAAARAVGRPLVSDLIGYGLTFGGRQSPLIAHGSKDVLRESDTVALDLVLPGPQGTSVQKKQVWLVEKGSATCLGRLQPEA